MTARERLPNRRPHETVSFEFRGLDYTVGVGRFADGSLAELFIDCFMGSSPLAADARDAAVALSISLQHDDDPVLRGKQCHSWFKMVVWQFSRLYTADDRARAAEEFAESFFCGSNQHSGKGGNATM